MTLQDEVRSYFAAKASQYDLTDEQPYWVLSDTLLWELLNTRVLSEMPETFSFLDAGGGTGRWTDRIMQSYPGATGMIVDLSTSMTDVAQAKAERNGYADRLDVKIGDLAEVESLVDGRTFDLVFNFHNVIGFVDDPSQVIKSFSKVRNGAAPVVTLAPNAYHMAYFNIGLNRLDEADRSLRDRKGRFTTEMPDVHCFTPADLRALYENAGLSVDVISGLPALIYPGYAETQITGSTQKLVDLLGDERSFTRVLEAEKAVLGNSDLAARGANLFISGR